MTPERKTAQQPKPIASTAAQLATWLIGHDDPEVVARLVVHSDGKVYDGSCLYFCKVCGCNSLDEVITLAICEPCRYAENGPSDDEIEDMMIEADIEHQECVT